MTKLNPHEQALLILNNAKRDIANVMNLPMEDYEVIERQLRDSIAWLMSGSRHKPLIRVALTQGSEPF
jgi:hypothetical protein